MKEQKIIVYCIEAESNCYDDEDYYSTLEEAIAAANKYPDKKEDIQIVKRTIDDDFCLAKWIWISENTATGGIDNKLGEWQQK